MRELQSHQEVIIPVETLEVRLNELFAKRGKFRGGFLSDPELIRIGPSLVTDRYRFASPQERHWIRDVLREHLAEWFPDVEAP